MTAATPATSWPLTCPADRAPLAAGPDAFACPACRRRYPVAAGVVDFLEAPNSFYEGAYQNETRFLPRGAGLLHEWPLWLISNGYIWAARRFLRSGDRVLELGCAGGVAWFGRRFRMAGVDFSQAGLTLAARKYEACLRTDAQRLPLADASLDGVVSSYFWEHVAPEDKAPMLAEIHRVLRPGGRVVFVYDVATDNPLIARLRRGRPDLYATEFLDQDGHVGYQDADENEASFRAGGFRLLRSNPMERSPLQSPSVYEKMTRWGGAAGAAGRVLTHLGRRPVGVAYMALLRLIDETVGRALPRRWGRITLLVAEKP